jgi:hypothetical protein
MQISEDILNFKNGPPGFKIRTDGATTTRSSKSAPDLAALASRRSQREEMQVEVDGSVGPGMDWEPSGVGSCPVFTINVGTEKETAAGDKQKEVREAEERRWSAVRSIMRDRYLEGSGGYEGLKAAKVKAEASVYSARAQELVERAVCDVCSHDGKRVWRTVKVWIVTFIAVHQLELPLWMCLR